MTSFLGLSSEILALLDISEVLEVEEAIGSVVVKAGKNDTMHIGIGTSKYNYFSVHVNTSTEAATIDKNGKPFATIGRDSSKKLILIKA